MGSTEGRGGWEKENAEHRPGVRVVEGEREREAADYSEPHHHREAKDCNLLFTLQYITDLYTVEAGTCLGHHIPELNVVNYSTIIVRSEGRCGWPLPKSNRSTPPPPDASMSEARRRLSSACDEG